MPTLIVERSKIKRLNYLVGVKRGGLPWHRLARVPSLELALDLIHDDATSLGRATSPLEQRGADAWVTFTAEDTYDVWCVPDS